MNLHTAREKIGSKLANVSEVAAGVLRGVRRRNDLDFASYVFDLNSQLPETIGGLSDYLDEVMGHTYFDESASPDLRWNNYLYFVVPREREKSPEFHRTKRNLEADRSYARKYVVFEEDFDRVLDQLDSVAVVDEQASAEDIVQAWSDGLSAVGLDDVLDSDRPITTIVKSISAGVTKQAVRTKRTSGVDASRQLISSHLTSIDLNGFRTYPKRRQFEQLGKANLVFGLNGVGKTSLLEGLEFLFCGANRRSPALPGSFVEGFLVSGAPVRTSATQLISDFKTRQRIWYGSDDNSRQNKLPNQFARFNFLNTDAAAELSLLKDDAKSGATGSPAESLAALLSGYEANQMWRRIQDARKAVREESTAKRSERAVAESDKKAVDQEVKALETIPGQADAAFAVFSKDLERIGWLNAPVDKQAVSERLTETLSSLTSQFGVVRQLDWMRPVVTESSVRDQLAALMRVSDGLKLEIDRIGTAQKRRQVLVGQQAAADARRIALAAITPAAVAELSRLAESLQQANDEFARTAQAFASLPRGEAPDGWEDAWGSRSVLDACNFSENALRVIGAELVEAERGLADATSRQSQLQSAMLALRDWAHKVVEHRHSDATCPVCGSEFGPGELLGRMESLAQAPIDAISLDLKRKVDELLARQAKTSWERAWLEQISTLSRVILEENSNTTIGEMVKAAAALSDRQRALLDTRRTAEEGLANYSRVGLSPEAIRKLCEPLAGDDQPSVAPGNVTDALVRSERRLLRLQGEVAAIDEEIRIRHVEARRMLAEIAIDVEQTPTAAMSDVQVRLRLVQRAVEVCSTARQFMDLQPEGDLALLCASLDAAVHGTQKVLAAVLSDSSSATRLTSLRAKSNQLMERLAHLREALERLGGAQRVLDDIIENQSLDAASAAVVAATHKVADSIFSRIHAPAEYRVTEDAAIPLRRRDNDAPVQLNEVSTGQRAAYALSMFLAMNAQVKEGPKVILLDDPISHIDDLNALSFLDYLRNLVLKSDRQLFFATADEKIAGLFAHKFGFLGKDFKTIELARG